MRWLGTFLIAVVVVSSLLADTPSTDYKKAVGPHPVAVQTFDWTDKKRDRRVPVKIYAPKVLKEPAAVIVYSHGLGGSRQGYEYLGRCWASHGYVSVHLQHIGSDESIWKDLPIRDRMAALKKALLDPQNALNRPVDVKFVLDELTELNRRDDTFKDKLDLDHVGMAGHSFGAWTTLACAGQTFLTRVGKENGLKEPRIKAAIAMSSPGPLRSDKESLARAYESITVPCLHMTGTKDTSPLTPETKPADRLLPFRYSTKCERYLLVFEDGDHMIFSGRGKLPGSERDGEFQRLIQQVTLAFWDAYLHNDAKAKNWLAKGAVQSLLGRAGQLEMALPSR